MISGGGAFSWGLYLVILASPLRHMPIYDALAEHVPDWTWPTVAVLFGAIQIIAAGFSLFRPTWGGWLPWNRWWRWWMAWAGFLWWNAIIVSMVRSDLSAPHIGIDCMLALGNGVVIVLMRPGRAGARHATG